MLVDVPSEGEEQLERRRSGAIDAFALDHDRASRVSSAEQGLLQGLEIRGQEVFGEGHDCGRGGHEQFGRRGERLFKDRWREAPRLIHLKELHDPPS